jgi:ribonuclease Z
MAEIHFLGTGGALGTRERDNTAFLLRAGPRAALIDCPGSVVQKVLRVGARPEDITDLFITHVHPDHVYGLPSLVHGFMLKDGVLKVFGSAETVDLCGRLLDLFGLRRAKYRTRVEFTALAPGEPVGVGEGLEVCGLRVPHHPSSLAFEFRLPDGAGKVLFSGDTPADPALFERARGADVLCHDCGGPARFFEQYPALAARHTSARDLGTWSERAAVRTLVPCHFLAELGFPVAEAEAEIRSGYSGRLVLPADLEGMTVP